MKLTNDTNSPSRLLILVGLLVLAVGVLFVAGSILNKAANLKEQKPTAVSIPVTPVPQQVENVAIKSADLGKYIKASLSPEDFAAFSERAKRNQLTEGDLVVIQNAVSQYMADKKPQ